MKTKYLIIMIVLIISAIAFEYYLMYSSLGVNNRVGTAVQAAAVFVALLAAIIALSSADQKPKKVGVTIELFIDPNHVDRVNKGELPDDLKLRYELFPDPITSHRVSFEIKNNSGFTLKKPTLTFRLPLEKQHPHKVRDQYYLSFNSNLFNSQSELRLLELADTRLLSNSNLPFWNNGDTITIWIRMVLDDNTSKPFTVDVSVNCENAEGDTKSVKVDSKKLLLEKAERHKTV